MCALDAGLGSPFSSFNVATGDYITVREIVALALEVLELDPTDTHVEYGREPRGWKGDVPVVRLNTERIRALGWHPSAGSAEALSQSMNSMLADLAVERG
jgi:UDP-glucose 4-epimerase